ncbi:MAG: three-Cys-motif partner protein TcmP [Verrucomicrobia bacterium]|nr:three-Cys-motif partner protein TcmP [Verrucomicrobiota bacterium]
MHANDFHEKPFDEGTLTKLRIFELYAREWLPVFLSAERPRLPKIHLFDFFAGPGTDSSGQLGSPLRLLRQLKHYQERGGLKRACVEVHLFDESKEKTSQLKENIATHGLQLPDLTFDVRPLAFSQAFRNCERILEDPEAAKLVFIDQFGVDHVTPAVFRTLVSSPICDFLFFLSSSTLYRFHDIPAIKQKIARPDDYFHVHRAALDYYRSLLPSGMRYFLAPFSIKKGANIYGLIFGSAHPLGIDKFLQVAWQSDEISGEADFDINRENIRPGEMLLAFEEMRPSKISAFDRELEHLLRAGLLVDEFDVMQVCFEHGVKRQHAEPVMAKLKREGVIDLDFRVPDVRRSLPRPIRHHRRGP